MASQVHAHRPQLADRIRFGELQTAFPRTPGSFLLGSSQLEAPGLKLASGPQRLLPRRDPFSESCFKKSCVKDRTSYLFF